MTMATDAVSRIYAADQQHNPAGVAHVLAVDPDATLIIYHGAEGVMRQPLRAATLASREQPADRAPGIAQFVQMADGSEVGWDTEMEGMAGHWCHIV